MELSGSIWKLRRRAEFICMTRKPIRIPVAETVFSLWHRLTL